MIEIILFFKFPTIFYIVDKTIMFDSSKVNKISIPDPEKTQTELKGHTTTQTGASTKEKIAVSGNLTTKTQGSRSARKPAATDPEKDRSLKFETRQPLLASNHTKSLLDKYIEHDQQWKVPKSQNGCELNHRNFFAEKKLKNFIEKKNVTVALSLTQEEGAREKDSAVMENVFKRMLRFIQNYQEDFNIPNEFLTFRKFQSSIKKDSNSEVFSEGFKIMFSKSVLNSFIGRRNIFLESVEVEKTQINTFQSQLQIFHEKLHEIYKPNKEEATVEKLRGLLDKFLESIKGKVDQDSNNEDNKRKNITEKIKACQICIQEILQTIDDDIINPSDISKCKEELFNQFHKDISALDLEKIYETIKKFCSGGLIYDLKQKIYVHLKKFNWSLLNDLLQKKSYVPPDSDELTSDDFDSYMRNSKGDNSNKVQENDKKQIAIKKMHFWYTLTSTFNEMEDLKAINESETAWLTTKSFLVKPLLSEQEKLENDLNEDLNVANTEEDVKRWFDEAKNVSKVINDCRFELVELYSDFVREIQENFEKIADGDLSNLIILKKLNFTSDTWHSAIHPMIAGILGYYDKLKSYKKEPVERPRSKELLKGKEDADKDKEKDKSYYKDENLPKITFLNFDGFDNPVNYYLTDSMAKHLQIISVTIDGDEQIMPEIEASMKDFNKSKTKKHFFSVPLRPANFKNKFKIKSKDFLQVFNTMIFKLIESHKPSMIVISHSFSFYHTINPENNLDLNPGTFAQIIEKLALLSNYKLVLYPNINVKGSIPKTDIFNQKFKYDDWQNNFSFKNREHVLENRRYLYEMIGAFITTISGKILNKVIFVAFYFQV